MGQNQPWFITWNPSPPAAAILICAATYMWWSNHLQPHHDFFQFNSSISPSTSIHNNHHSTPMLTHCNAIVRHQGPIQHKPRCHQQHGHNSTPNLTCRSWVGANACRAFVLFCIISVIWCIWYVSHLLYFPVALMVIHPSRKLVNHSIAA